MPGISGGRTQEAFTFAYPPFIKWGGMIKNTAQRFRQVSSNTGAERDKHKQSGKDTIHVQLEKRTDSDRLALHQPDEDEK